MDKSFEEMIGSCDIFAGCEGVEALPSAWRGADGQLEKLVVFGYGSVIWKPGIEFEESHVGYINGFVRRMWQGNETHRGRKGRPGRVATLIPKSNRRTFGKAFVLKSKEQIAAAMDHLIMREISLGGYCLGFTPFHRLDAGISSLRSSSSSSPFSSFSLSSSTSSPTSSPSLSTSSSPSSSIPSSPSSASLSSISEDEGSSIFASVPALVFSATEENEFYLGPEKMLTMAKTIADAEGPSGHNLEYLVKICDFMREELPSYVGDDHLFRLEKLTLQCIAARGINFEALAYPERFENSSMKVDDARTDAAPKTPLNSFSKHSGYNPDLVQNIDNHHRPVMDNLNAILDSDVELSYQPMMVQENDDTWKDSERSSNPKNLLEMGHEIASSTETDRRHRHRTGTRCFYFPEQ